MTTPLWVPLVVAALGIVSTVVGIVVTPIMANRRQRASWQRDTDREQQRWQREDQARTFEHRHTAYVEFYEALRAMMLRVYDHGMVCRTRGTSCPKDGRTTQPKRFGVWKSMRHPMFRLERLRPMTRRGAGVKPPATARMTKRSTTTKRLPTLRKSNY